MQDLLPVHRLTRDLASAAHTLTADEARYLVDAYYMMQEDRIRSSAQVRALGENEEPHTVIQWLAEQSATLESQIKRALDKYASSDPVGEWSMSVCGIGPVIAAGLLAHIDIQKCPTVGHIWRFAGLDPTVKWEKKTKRPWNARLKTLCWKIGESFVKVSGNDKDVYGKIYIQRKEYEIARNDRGENAATAADVLTAKKIGKDTEAFKHLSEGKLPPGQLHARAKRYAVKLFLSHLHCVWYYSAYKTLPPKPYVVENLGHVNIIWPPNLDYVPGLREAIRAQGPWDV
ncbi:MAG: transposase [Bryobacteraceae bacterium]